MSEKDFDDQNADLYPSESIADQSESHNVSVNHQAINEGTGTDASTQDDEDWDEVFDDAEPASVPEHSASEELSMQNLTSAFDDPAAVDSGVSESHHEQDNDDDGYGDEDEDLFDGESPGSDDGSDEDSHSGGGLSKGKAYLIIGATVALLGGGIGGTLFYKKQQASAPAQSAIQTPVVPIAQENLASNLPQEPVDQAQNISPQLPSASDDLGGGVDNAGGAGGGLPSQTPPHYLSQVRWWHLKTMHSLKSRLPGW